MPDRQTTTVLVMHAHVIAAVACIRSLGRAGYRVIACSPQADALGFYSNYTSESLVHPPYRDQADFRRWLDETVDRHRIDVIVPTEELLLTLLPDIARYADLLPCSTEPDIVRLCFSKYRLFERFIAASRCTALHPLGEHLPRTWLVDPHTAPVVLAELPADTPLYLKADALLATDHRGSVVRRVHPREIDRSALEALLAQYHAFILQEAVPGVGVGAFFLQWQDRVLASFMHRRLHEVPHTGGVSSYRTAWWHRPIYEDALARLRHLGWQGIAMFEYRWDPATDEFHLLEMNSRYWGSMHLPLYAGVDFPRLWIDAFIGLAVRPVERFRTDVTCRNTFPGELRHLGSRLRDGRVPLAEKLASLVEFAALSANPHVKSDLWFPGDRQLYLRGLCQYLGSKAPRRSQRRLSPAADAPAPGARAPR